jgi:polygalacturonase
MWLHRFRFLNLALPTAMIFGVSTALTPAAPVLPNINTNNIITITNAPYNGTNDGITDNAVAISNAIVAASAGGNVGGLYGGTVRIPGPGVYLSGPFPLKNNVNLQIDAGAVLRLLPYGTYPGSPYSTAPANFISGSGLTNIAVTGPGTIDGQGSAWWTAYNADSTIKRPVVIGLSSCSRVLLRYFTSSNPPAPHISVKGNNAGNVTFLGITNRAPATSPNTDSVDFAETNALFQDCVFDSGDDCIAMGSSAGLTRDVVVTNCYCYAGHGISIGSYTSSGVSNLLVIDTHFIGTDNGIRLKSQRDRGGLVQNLNYINLTMTNVPWPFLINSYYEYGLGTITPANSSTAAKDAATNSSNGASPPVWRNITFSNITAYANNSRPSFMIWGLPLMAVSNVVFINVTNYSTRTAEIFNARGIRFVDTPMNLPSTTNGFDLYNAEIIITNSVPGSRLSLINGVSTNDTSNILALYNARATLKNTNTFDDGPLTLSDSTLTISNNFMMFPGTVLNYVVDGDTNRVAVVGNLTLGGTINISTNTGFGPGTNILLTHTGTLSGSLPALGSTPGGAYTYTLNTNTAGLVRLIVALSAPPAPTNFTATGTNLLIQLKWNAVSGATGYNLKRGTADSGPYPTVYSGLTATNYADAAVTNAVAYYYVVTAVAASESTNSLQASAVPLPSAVPTNIVAQVSSGRLQLSWPQDHQGWRLQIQTNTPSTGLGNNWVTVPDSTNVYQISIPIDPDNGSVFLRLAYP